MFLRLRVSLLQPIFAVVERFRIIESLAAHSARVQYYLLCVWLSGLVFGERWLPGTRHTPGESLWWGKPYIYYQSF